MLYAIDHLPCASHTDRKLRRRQIFSDCQSEVTHSRLTGKLVEARSGYASNYPNLLEGLKGISTRSKIMSSAIFAVKPVQSQAISNRTHFSRTPKKPEYLIARSQLTERGPLGFGPIQFLMDTRFTNPFFSGHSWRKGYFPGT